MKRLLAYMLAAAIGVAMAVVIGILFRMTPPSARTARAPSDLKAASAAKLRQIANAAELWRFDIGDGTRYPSSLERLAEGGLLPEPEAFLHPSRTAPPAEEGFVSDYESLFDVAGFGLEVPEEFPSELMLVWEKKGFQADGRNVVFAVRSVAPPDAEVKYLSTCVIRAGQSEVAAILTGSRQRGAPNSQALVRAHMLRYDNVMTALSRTYVMGEIEAATKGDFEARQEMLDRLYQEVIQNTHIEWLGGFYIQVSYLDEGPRRALTILEKLTVNFVENALAQEREVAARARAIAQKKLQTWRGRWQLLEAQIAVFCEQHPVVSPEGESDIPEMRRDALREKERLEREISRKQRHLDWYNEQLENMPRRIIVEAPRELTPETKALKEELALLEADLTCAQERFGARHLEVKAATAKVELARHRVNQAVEADTQPTAQKANPTWELLQEKKLELESDLEGDRETMRRLERQVRRHEAIVAALPGLQRELARLHRDRAEAANRYDRALAVFRRVDEAFNTTREGLLSFRIVDPARQPRTPYVGPLLKKPYPGGRVRFVSEERFQQLLEKAKAFIEKQESGNVQEDDV